MKGRWRAVGVLAGSLFAVNVVARVVIKLGFEGDDSAADRVTWAMFLAIGVVLAVTAFRWGQDRPVSRWAGDVAAAVAIALLLTVLVGPLLVGANPFGNGAGTFFLQVWLYLAATGAGVLVGFLTLTALGRDHRSVQLQRYAEIKAAKPRRPVRR
ncbi:hypothetical protein ACFY2R_06825 [Micromonospora olivasterospora]|uniref:Uncharacterized protein n=1 Tax=Micromonospora olivasterospora TaxID=1880 RepID=A0A562I706_MICOL|nr:hypothetical protein [Micromonospora olivasterospora]TWH66453.1 hypothetical protein JD77_01407 [Micromonospora olivasterospora]